jgi:hypothetical protein
MIANFTNEALTIPKATVLGIAEVISELLVDSIYSDSDLPTNRVGKIMEHFTGSCYRRS